MINRRLCIESRLHIVCRGGVLVAVAKIDRGMMLSSCLVCLFRLSTIYSWLYIYISDLSWSCNEKLQTREFKTTTKLQYHGLESFLISNTMSSSLSSYVFDDQNMTWITCDLCSGSFQRGGSVVILSSYCSVWLTENQ